MTRTRTTAPLLATAGAIALRLLVGGPAAADPAFFCLAFAPPLHSTPPRAFAPPPGIASSALLRNRAESSSSTRAYLFRDLIKKVRGKDDGDGDGNGDGDDEDKKSEEEVQTEEESVVAKAAAEAGPDEEEKGAEAKAEPLPVDKVGVAERAGGARGGTVPFFARMMAGEKPQEEVEEAPKVEEVEEKAEAAAAQPEQSLAAAVEVASTEDDESVVEEKAKDTAAEDAATAPAVPDTEAIVAAAAITAAAAAVAEKPEALPAPEPEEQPQPAVATAVAAPVPEKKAKPLSAVEEARALRAAAEKARLEAERMDAQLTLEKIAKLEKELGSKKTREDADRARDIRNQLDQLNKKLSGEDPVVKKREEEKKKESEKADSGMASTVSPLYSRDAVTGETKLNIGGGMDEKKAVLDVPGTEPLTDDEIARRVELFNKSPDFLKVLVATTAGFENVRSASDVNATALVLKLHEDDVKFRKNQAEVEAENFDLVELTEALKKSGGEVKIVNLSDSTERPTFTKEQIEAKVKDLEAVPQFVKNLFPDEVAKNDTALAIKMLTDDWENEQMASSLWGGGRDKKKKKKSGDSSKEGDSSLFGGGGFGAFDDMSETDRMIQSLFPKQVTEREDADETMPNDATMKIVMEDVLTKLKLFSPSGQAEKVSGGYIVRGVNSYDDGAALIDALDAQMAKSPRAKGRVLIHYISDPTPVTEEQLMMGDRDPVLYVTSPELEREGNRLVLAGISSTAIASTWYTALYPFLINPDVLKRAEEQLDLANAGMEYNLDWLTGEAVPLYGAFVAAIAAHEIAHRVVAGAYGLNVTVPTLIPSLVTGVTGQITAFKTPPKDRQQMLDFALAGPVAGIVTSAALMFVGCMLTSTADAGTYANFPALPVDVLRQSSLGAGIIEAVLGNGLLSVPVSAAATSAVADINISLHPFAIAGFFGLLVNACALLPFGRTDGGRIATALFGRSGKQLVGLITLLTLFLAGLTVSDLLLFYFSFIAFFQGELEMPCRNEVDEVDFSRVLLATAGGVLMLLTLIPMV